MNATHATLPRSLRSRSRASMLLPGLALCLAACGGDVSNIAYDDGSPWQQIERKDGHRHGAFRRWHPGGVIEVEASYSHGLPDGAWCEYDREGQMLLEESWSNGVRDGVAKSWYPNGQLKSEGAWIQGERDGDWRFYLPDGSNDALAKFQSGTRISMTRYNELAPEGD